MTLTRIRRSIVSSDRLKPGKLAGPAEENNWAKPSASLIIYSDTLHFDGDLRGIFE